MMNRTNNYNLCQWEETDRVQRTDFNEDNAKIDAAVKAVDRRVDGLEGSKASVSALNALVSRVTALEQPRIYIGSYVGNATASRVISLPWTPTLILIAGILSSATALFLISQDGSINFINSNAHIPPHEKSPILNGAKLVVRDDSWCNQKGSTYPFIMFR